MTGSSGRDPDVRLRLRPDRVMWREVGGEIVALSLSSSQYLTVNTQAAQLWRLLGPGATPRELADALDARWQLGRERAEQDVDRFLSELSEMLESVE
jgi:Coenzyme PQQ synthesis protein D (PqqD)